VPAPAGNVPGVAVLDSGVVQNHPFLAPAIGDAQSFISGLPAEDEHGHGTLVCGIALYGDVARQAENRQFIPHIRLFSGRILDGNNQTDGILIENSIESAVRYFYEQYGCRVFNISYGDTRKPYQGGHVRGLAVTLDSLARELGVLFVVPTGNFVGVEGLPANWRAEYPNYLLSNQAALLDPAPAINVLTVGSLARWDATFASQRYVDDPSQQPIARHDCPSPFSRSGHSVGGAIKPEITAYGGNWAVDVRTSDQWIIRRGLGELSTAREFLENRLLAEESGTSFAAPTVAHFAARILAEHPDADVNLLRGLLAAHTRWPDACSELLPEKNDRLRLCGYGRMLEDALLRSDNHEVTIIAQESIPDRSNHFFELPVPDTFWQGSRRPREVTVALVHTPAVRTTRVAYKTTRIGFRFVSAPNLQRVTTMFNAATSPEEYERIPEVQGAEIGTLTRSSGTLQRDRWTFRQPSRQRRDERLFIVVTRNDFDWARQITLNAERYALVIVLRDRENAEAQLYAQVQARLAARIRPRVRV
jgi:hypothetical protein